ncbi:hypothetical protein P280DRAFT_252197 [Massarina eburnea CBS 473.64]|uniref:Uncharacterized protein n=1 Tax=Massarina eburnea CBS 473.64 TaxID=1395130 RepID=A0A6A6S6A5_9PLEO|nr:hypothetical protein P280DRAFT_252197 [Massarina eburnea CBS 473.64]
MRGSGSGSGEGGVLLESLGDGRRDGRERERERGRQRLAGCWRRMGSSVSRSVAGSTGTAGSAVRSRAVQCSRRAHSYGAGEVVESRRRDSDLAHTILERRRAAQRFTFGPWGLLATARLDYLPRRLQPRPANNAHQMSPRRSSTQRPLHPSTTAPTALPPAPLLLHLRHLRHLPDYSMASERHSPFRRAGPECRPGPLGAPPDMSSDYQ